MKFNFGPSKAFLPGYGSVIGLAIGALVNAFKPVDYGMSSDDILKANMENIENKGMYKPGNNKMF